MKSVKKPIQLLNLASVTQIINKALGSTLSNIQSRLIAEDFSRRLRNVTVV